MGDEGFDFTFELDAAVVVFAGDGLATLEKEGEDFFLVETELDIGDFYFFISSNLWLLLQYLLQPLLQETLQPIHLWQARLTPKMNLLKRPEALLNIKTQRIVCNRRRQMVPFRVSLRRLISNDKSEDEEDEGTDYNLEKEPVANLLAAFQLPVVEGAFYLGEELGEF